MQTINVHTVQVRLYSFFRFWFLFCVKFQFRLKRQIDVTNYVEYHVCRQFSSSLLSVQQWWLKTLKVHVKIYMSHFQRWHIGLQPNVTPMLEETSPSLGSDDRQPRISVESFPFPFQYQCLIHIPTPIFSNIYSHFLPFPAINIFRIREYIQ